MTSIEDSSTEALWKTAYAETQRLKMHFGQRSMVEKKRMTQLETLVPKLRHLVKIGGSAKGELTKEEFALLEWLSTPQVK